jgi:hypothetical protein
VRNLQTDNGTTAINAHIDGAFLGVGLIAVIPGTSNPIALKDMDTGILYKVELPSELLGNPLIVTGLEVKLPIIEISQ